MRLALAPQVGCPDLMAHNKPGSGATHSSLTMEWNPLEQANLVQHATRAHLQNLGLLALVLLHRAESKAEGSVRAKPGPPETHKPRSQHQWGLGLPEQPCLGSVRRSAPAEPP